MAFRLLSGLAIAISFCVGALAAEIHYDSTTKQVLGFTLVPISPAEGVSVITVDYATPTWPPPSGCAVGDERWTLVDESTNPPSLRVNPDLIFFLCLPVRTRAEVWEVVSIRAAELLGNRDPVDLLEDGNKAMYILAVECPQAGISQQCDEKRQWAQQKIDELMIVEQQRRDLIQQANEFIDLMGW
ncbi:MAG: hypothetical protein QXD59_02050 [Candidatus Caldarchaeum sp.]